MASPAEKSRRGRRQGAAVAREDVLAAAKERFATHGYDKTTLRQVAGDIGVDPSMVLYLFGSKEALFRESMRLVIDPRKLAAALAEGPVDGIGERLVRTYLEIWESSDTQSTMVAMLTSATSNPHAHEAFRDFMRDYVLTAVSAALGGAPDARLRAMLAATSLVGTALMRYVMRVGPLAEVSGEELVRMLTPGVQRYLTADVDELGLPDAYRP